MKTASPFRCVALIGRYQTAGLGATLSAITRFLSDRGVEVLLEADTAGSVHDPLAKSASMDEIGRTADLAVAVGGDGTMLGVARRLAPDGVPLVGINHGRLGFITDISLDAWRSALGAILDGKFDAEDRTLITARVVRDGETVWSDLALNDVVVNRSSRSGMIELEVAVDGVFMYSQRADGLIVATPTGSTAYALSCGGPIIEPALNAVVVVPVCPHTLSDRPIVVPADREIEVRLLAYSDSKAEVMVDGRLLGALEPTDRLLIREADRRITLIHPPGYDYFDLLRSKLHWGRDSRVRAGDGRR